MKRAVAVLVLMSMAAAGTGCDNRMVVQPRYSPYAHSGFFADGRASRHLPPGVVHTEEVIGDSLLREGLIGGAAADVFPFTVTAAVLERGAERYRIFCAPCHGHAGYGDGMIVQRGLRPPPSFHSPKIRQQPVGHYVQVMARGYGTMSAYAEQTSSEDRWAIAAWLRALQLSQHAPAAVLTDADRQQLERQR